MNNSFVSKDVAVEVAVVFAQAPSYPVHTETFSCVFVLFTVLKGIENNQLITWNNTKTQENVSVCTGPNNPLIEVCSLWVPTSYLYFYVRFGRKRIFQSCQAWRKRRGIGFTKYIRNIVQSGYWVQA